MLNSVERSRDLLIRAGAATLSVATLGLAKDAQADSPNVQVPTGEYQTISQNGVELTQIYKGEGSNKITARIFLDNYANYQEGKEAAKKFVEYFFLPYPLSNHLKDYDFWVVNPTGLENPQCRQSGLCPFDPYIRNIDRVISATGIQSQEHFMLIKSNDWRAGGQSQLALLGVPPSIKNFVGVVLPLNLIDDNLKMAPAHEWGHRVGFPTTNDHNSIMGDLGARRFNEQESAWIERIFANNWRFNHLTPSLEARTQRGISSLSIRQQAEQLLDLNLISLIYSPEGTEQIKIYISPANNKFSGQPDGPDISIQLGSLTSGNEGLRHALTEAGMIIREPVMGSGPYIVLPDMTYTWTVCASGQLLTPLPWNSEKWQEAEIWPGRKISYPCQKIEMKTAPTDSTAITPVTLANGIQTDDLTPTVRWENSRKNIFYYEVQLSADPDFEMDPAKAKAAVYWNLIHGGETNPLNSWTVPDQFPLQLGQTYYWRVRPRIQGDGTPVEWSQIGRFSTPSALKSVYGKAGPSAEDSAITITLVQEVEGPGGIKEVVSYPHIIPIDNQAYRRKEESLAPAV